MGKYARFMVFVWGDYDNVDPFSCVSDSFACVNLAEDHMQSLIADGSQNACVFDRIEGVVIHESISN